jgi:hypothetical protein
VAGPAWSAPGPRLPEARALRRARRRTRGDASTPILPDARIPRRGQLPRRYASGRPGRKIRAPFASDCAPDEPLELLPYRSHRRALELQRDSEALLLLIPDAGGRGEGILSGKVFEYLAAERPILALVPTEGAAATPTERHWSRQRRRSRRRPSDRRRDCRDARRRTGRTVQRPYSTLAVGALSARTGRRTRSAASLTRRALHGHADHARVIVSSNNEPAQRSGRVRERCANVVRPLRVARAVESADWRS